MFGLILNPKPDVEALAAYLGSTVEELPDDLDDWIEQSRNALTELIDEEADALRAKADRLWETLDQPDRASAPERCLIDLSPEGLRLDRLEADADRQLQRNLALLATSRQEVRKGERAQNEAILARKRAERGCPQSLTEPCKGGGGSGHPCPNRTGVYPEPGTPTYVQPRATWYMPNGGP
jgi:hypothetical protein